MIEQQIHVADRPPAPQTTLECRVYPRQACHLPASCQPTSAWGKKDARWPAAITDVSQGGLRLVVRRRFEPGTGLGVELPGQDGEEPYTVLAKVVHVKVLPDGTWALGCKFISEIGEDELQRLVPSAQPSPSPNEQNISPISPSQHLQDVFSQKAAPDSSGKKAIYKVLFQIESSPGKSVNCRIQRLSVPQSWPPAVGETLSMHKSIPQRTLPALRLKVVRCWLEGDCWTLRCQLLNPPSDDILRVLRPAAPTTDQ